MSPSVLCIVSTQTLPPFQRLVDAHWRDVSRLAYALAGAADAEDVAQQAWAQAFAAYPALRSASNLRSWLLTITHRCATDAHRARGRRPVPVPVGPDDDAGAATSSGPEPPGGDGGIPEDGILDGAVWDAVRALPDRQRTALVLRYVADLDHPTIAAELGTTPAASRRLVADALAALRAALPSFEELLS